MATSSYNENSYGREIELLATPEPAVSIYCGGNVVLMVDARRQLHQLAIGPTLPICFHYVDPNLTRQKEQHPYQPASGSSGYAPRAVINNFAAKESTPPHMTGSFAKIRGVSGVTHVACGRKHTIVLGEWNGHPEVWGVGRNHEGQLAVGSSIQK